MRRSDLLSRAEDLRRARTPYVLATVVRAQRPTSAKAGDCALVLADGTLDGFVGGTCAESTVLSQGLLLLKTGESTLLRITPSAEENALEEEGLVVVNNPCLSGGSLDIFLEAMLPCPLIHVYGESPVARALQAIGTAAGYEMSLHPIDFLVPPPPDLSAVIIASHGKGEETLLEAALRADVPYIALVASRKRGDTVLANLGTTRDRVHTPAGLDLGARTAPDVAISILAELIAARRAIAPAAGTVMPSPATSGVASPAAGKAPAGPPLGHVVPTVSAPGIAAAPSGPAPGSGMPEPAARSSRFNSPPSLFETAARRVLPVLQPAVAIDPICHMEVVISASAIQAEHEGEKYYFCASGCKAAFLKDPHRYLAQP